jgi:hypothetical protein
MTTRAGPYLVRGQRVEADLMPGRKSVSVTPERES